MFDKLKDAAGDAAKNVDVDGLAEKAGDIAGDLAEKASDALPDSVKDKAGDLASKASEVAADAVGKLADKLKK